MKRPPMPSDSYENDMSKLAKMVSMALSLAILLPMMLLVLLPMFWMVLTALKVPGTAFKLQFVPDTRLYNPTEQFDPLPVAQLSPDAGWMYLEYTVAGATTVTAQINNPEGELEEIQLSRLGTDVWALQHGPVPPGEYGYVFSVSGAAPVPDPKNPQRDGRNREQSMLSVEAGKIVHAPEPKFTAFSDGGKLKIEFREEPGKEMGLQLFEVDRSNPDRQGTLYSPVGEVISLSESTAGVFTGEGEAPTGILYFRLVETLPFGTALGKIYTLENFKAIVTNPSFNFARYFMNSLIVATGAGLLTVIICTMAGYAFVRVPFHGRNTLFVVLLSSMLVPGMIYMVPQFSITLSLGLMDSYGGMIIPHLANVFGLFLMKQYIEQIPSDVFSAAEIDGAKDHQIFLTIVIPMCLPIIVTLFLLTFVGQWSNFLWQLIVNTGYSEVLTLPVGLQQFKGQNANEWEKIMAGACFSLIPITILFLFLQRYFLEAVAAGSVKE
ncbi:MAG: ABC transporter permease subunit [Candidatus Sumerlaeia bacterium]|nr:ABC transporter permease subunit [Candidatus Sumerlaeia bacterium]